MIAKCSSFTITIDLFVLQTHFLGHKIDLEQPRQRYLNLGYQSFGSALFQFCFIQFLARPIGPMHNVQGSKPYHF